MQGIERQADQYDYTEAVQQAPERTASGDLPSVDEVKDFLGGPRIAEGTLRH